MRITPEISFRQAVTTGSTFHSVDCKTCLLVWHIKPAHQTQSVTSRENNHCVQVCRLGLCTQSQTGIMGMMSEHWDFWHVSNISRDFERDWIRAFFHPVGALSPISAFEEFDHYFPTTKHVRTGKGQIHDPFVNKPDDSTLSMIIEGCLLEITNDSGLRVCLR